MRGKTNGYGQQNVQNIPSSTDDFERQFAYVDSIINSHRTTAIATVNMESLLTAWEVGQYISNQLKSSHWGSKVVSELADYLKRQNPKRRGFGKRNLYNMVKFFDTYNSIEFARITQKSKINEFVQLETAQIGSSKESNEIVQLATAQKPIPLEVMQRSLEEYCSFLGDDITKN